MTHWLYPANTSIYDVFGAFAESQTYWPMTSKVAVGDVVFVYLAAPYKQIGFAADVVGIGYPASKVMAAVRPFFKKGAPNADGKAKTFMKLADKKTFEISTESALTLSNLKQHGLNGMLMGARKLQNNPALLAYLERHL